VLTKFPGLVTLGRYNSAMITDSRKFTFKLTITKCLLTVLSLESIQSLSPGLYAPYRKRTCPNFRHRPMSDIAY